MMRVQLQLHLATAKMAFTKVITPAPVGRLKIETAFSISPTYCGCCAGHFSVEAGAAKAEGLLAKKLSFKNG